MKPQKTPLRNRAYCRTCEYAEMHESNDALFRCRRHAPLLINSAGGAVFPVVHDDDWCGDFREEANAD